MSGEFIGLMMAVISRQEDDFSQLLRGNLYRRYFIATYTFNSSNLQNIPMSGDFSSLMMAAISRQEDDLNQLLRGNLYCHFSSSSALSRYPISNYSLVWELDYLEPTISADV